MNLFGNLAGGAYAAYKAANKFSLNKVKVDVEVPKYNREQIPRNIEESRSTWRQSELDVGKDYEGYDAQKSFINGEEVPYGTKGSVSPEFYKNGHSVEVKNYNVETSSGRNSLINNVSSQIKKRLTNLPEVTEQTVVIDVRGQDYNLEILRDIKNKIIGLKVDLYWYSIGTGDFLHSFFSTICVRLENNVWGSRFPILMNELYSGRLDPQQLEEALRELETIQKELERINPDQVVWDKEDRSKMPPWGDNISPDIKALSDYFVTSSGKNLISVIKRALLDAIDEQVKLEIKSL